jgi:hypothetical protein
MSEEGAGAAAEDAHHDDAHHDDEIHMPPNSYWPLVTSVGAAASLFGIIYITSFPVIFIVGLVILAAGVGLWIRDARREYDELH